ncbi:hypothetical protein JQ580_26660 [Bradyrhizobium japonicum]|uniref:hypothetical protein n=1 Tax=Bradyrhizobium japonicum TaxID=375 RepID=UPI001BADB771|nr:hypothetical protein [Bradyrhizobium japonicum]MBR0994309.1 hypothetical protein [Bradyrhizobium japonicum]
MKATTFTLVTAAMFAALAPGIGEARDRTELYSKSEWRRNYGYDARLWRTSNPILTVVTPDLSHPVSAYAYNRLDDGYDYPFGYGEYAIYGKWARDAYGRADVTRCRLVWADGLRWRSLNRCN